MVSYITVFHTLLYIVVLYIAVVICNLWSSNMDVYTENEVFIFWHGWWLHFLSSLHIWLLSFTDIYWYTYSGSMLPYLLCVFSSYSKYYFSFFTCILYLITEFQSRISNTFQYHILGKKIYFSIFWGLQYHCVLCIIMFPTIVYIVVIYIAVVICNLWSSNMDVYTENEVFIFWHGWWLHFLSSLHIWLLSFTDIYWHSYSCSMLP